MNITTRILGWLVAWLVCGCAHRGVVADAQEPVAVEFVGTTPGDGLARAFVGGLAGDAPCHSISWRITLSTHRNTGQPATFNLSARYHVPARDNPNRSEDGPKVGLRGEWEILAGTKTGPERVVYRIRADQPERSLLLARVGDGLLHLLNADGSLAVGNGGWSYTLNRADRAEKPGDMLLALAAPEMSYKISPLATGPAVFGVFEGRSPCQGISRELKLPQHAGCIKVKWRVTLYRNPDTWAPTTYKLEGSLHRQGAREGTWSEVRGSANDPHATVYRLDPAQAQPALWLLKADDNVLFFLNERREPLVGHADFSYTLNRVAAK